MYLGYSFPFQPGYLGVARSLKVLVNCDEPCSYEVPCADFFKRPHYVVGVWHKRLSLRDVTL